MPCRFLKHNGTYHPFIRVLVYANIYIALCAAAQVVLTQRVFDIRFGAVPASYILFILLSTYVQYNMQRGYVVASEQVHTERAVWVLKHRKIMLASNFMALFVLLFLCNDLSWTAIGIMIGAEIVSSLYYLPPFNLRRYGYIKPFLLGAVWAISCVLVPLIENGRTGEQACVYALSQFCFVSALCVLFDIKDAAADKANDTHTYANRFGITVSRSLAIILIVAGGVSFLCLNISPLAKVANSAVMLLSIALVFLSHDRQHSFFYYLLIDGLMLLQALAVSVAMQW